MYSLKNKCSRLKWAETPVLSKLSSQIIPYVFKTQRRRRAGTPPQKESGVSELRLKLSLKSAVSQPKPI